MEQRLNERQSELDQRDHEQDKRDQWFDERDSYCDERENYLVGRERELSFREMHWNRRRSELDQDRQLFDERSRDLSERSRRTDEIRQQFLRTPDELHGHVNHLAARRRAYEEVERPTLVSLLRSRQHARSEAAANSPRNLDAIVRATAVSDLGANDSCPICYRTFGDEEEAVCLIHCCFNNIGQACLATWLEEHDTRCLCRANFVQMGLLRPRHVVDFEDDEDSDYGNNSDDNDEDGGVGGPSRTE